MNGLYTEAGCKPARNTRDYAVMVAGAVAAVICAGLILVSGMLILRIAGVAGIVALVFLYPGMKYEYEYVFCDGQIDFDKILSGRKRKHILRMDMENMEICAPAGGPEVASFHGIRTRDFSSRRQGARTYAAIVSIDNERVRILFDPSDKMIEMMYRKAPRKIVC